MAKQGVSASLDAFDSLIADLAAAGEVPPAEVTALRAQLQVPQTGQIPVQGENRWNVAPTLVETVVNEVAELAVEAFAPQPMTRREARARERAAEAAAAVSVPAAPGSVAPGGSSTDEAVEAENARRTEELIHSRRVRPAAPVASVAPAAARTRRGARTAVSAVALVLLAPALFLVTPANAVPLNGYAPTVDDHGRTAQQILSVARDVASPSVEQIDFTASALAGIVAKEGGADAEAAAPAIAAALQVGGARQKIVEVALTYLGTPYVLGGDSYLGIDCSGLTMDAYRAVGVELPHYVPTQDARGTRITEAEAQPGDLVTFDNEDHVGIYLGGGQLLHAPAPGRKVSIESVDVWKPVGIHFTRILPAGQ